jgi:hypothetical protein
MPLSEDEQRILQEIERSLSSDDPAFAERVRSHTVYRQAGRNCKWAAIAFVAGLVLMIFSFASSVFLGLLGFLVMLASALFFQHNLRLMGKAGINDAKHALGAGSLGEAAGALTKKLGERFRRSGGEPPDSKPSAN